MGVISTNSWSGDICSSNFSEQRRESASCINVRRKVITDPQVVKKVRELIVTFFFVESFVFGIAHSTDWPFREKPATNRSVECSKLRSRREAALSHEALPTNGNW